MKKKNAIIAVAAGAGARRGDFRLMAEKENTTQFHRRTI